MVDPTGELSLMQRKIEATRHELEVAVSELESAAQELVTARHWREVGGRIWRRRPIILLTAAFGLGFWVGYKRRAARETVA